VGRMVDHSGDQMGGRRADPMEARS
jgi:hypothetical protein